MQLTLFSPEVARSLRHQIFAKSALGQFHGSLPIAELAELLPKPRTKVGAKPWFDNSGKIALQFLKAYQGCSDAVLLERLNTDWALQLFCGIQLGPNEMIKDKDLIWKTRSWVARHLEMDQAQALLIQYWKPWMDQLHLGLCDATCYESYIKYPTDVELLWDCIEWLHKQIKRLSKALGQKRPRSKYKEQKKKHLSYQRQRRKTYKQRRSRQRQLLYLCQKLVLQLGPILDRCRRELAFDQALAVEALRERFGTIAKILAQQSYHYDHPGESIPDRIVSLYKPYIHPIVRGKQNKRVEFGAKVNSWQVDGLNFIEHLSFSAFHEGNRLKNGIAFHNRHFGKLSQLGADQIYATNANRRLCRKLSIDTCFKPKGRRTQDPALRKQQDQLRKAIGTARATILEGTYGNDKNHYGLQKVKARNEANEVAWIFFGMMSANAVKIAKRKLKAARTQAKARAA